MSRFDPVQDAPVPSHAPGDSGNLPVPVEQVGTLARILPFAAWHRNLLRHGRSHFDHPPLNSSLTNNCQSNSRPPNNRWSNNRWSNNRLTNSRRMSIAVVDSAFASSTTSSTSCR